VIFLSLWRDYFIAMLKHSLPDISPMFWTARSLTEKEGHALTVFGHPLSTLLRDGTILCKISADAKSPRVYKSRKSQIERGANVGDASFTG
jgi:hypothetical protein